MARLVFALALLLTGCDHCAKVCDVKPEQATPSLGEETESGRKVLVDLRRYNVTGAPPPAHLVRGYCDGKWEQVIGEHCTPVVDKFCENTCQGSDTITKCKVEERDALVQSCAERSVALFKQVLTKCASVTGVDSKHTLRFN